MALLVVVAGVAVPLLLQGGKVAELQDASDKLSAAWGRARLDAVQRGQPLFCQLSLGGSMVQTGAMTSAMGTTATGALPPDAQPAAASETLELTNVVLAGVSIAEPAGAEPVAYGPGDAPAVVFRPDGGASDAEVLLQHNSGLQQKVILRGLTGAVRVEDVVAE